MATFLSGSVALIRPRMASRIGIGSSRISAASISSNEVGPQPILTIGPKVKRPSAGGKTARSAAIRAGALAAGSFGNKMASRVRCLTPERSASVFIVRLMPSRPPTSG